MGSIATQAMGEFIGTLVLIVLGDGVCAAVNLNKSKAQGSDWVVIALGWGLAVTMGAYVGGMMGPAHLNPAVTIGFAVVGLTKWAAVVPFIIAQMLGAIVGAIIVWLAYLPHWKATEDQDAILGTFATEPAIRSLGANFITELIGTAVLVLGLASFGHGSMADGLNPLVAGSLIVSIGLSLGGPTGYAINPARDLGPRLAHAMLPIANKGGNDWGYSWVPVAGPLVGGIIGALVFAVLPL
ncbi:glycerol uptake facilitator protein [Ligilactobacillus salitolerans]|uniref:Glycerol uptake facilitator protein n=1 Tax=Ligilactobacillus salitolerans TaxID=1808352 RepID=A0A401IUW5_9LACO|nr:MIP/aquaporin family protein [Ligilactobacillus salitolerans]GBG95340.1 glycerol uptake facilitator protein [Ligilactobacillus salitolerans]